MPVAHFKNMNAIIYGVTELILEALAVVWAIKHFSLISMDIGVISTQTKKHSNCFLIHHNLQVSWQDEV